MIRQRGDSWYCYSDEGKKMGGPYKSKREALRRLKQLEYYKHEKEEGMEDD